VNNAAVSIYGPVLDQPLADQRRLFETNYWGMVNGSLVACAHLRQNGGALINIGSVLSDVAIPIQGHPLITGSLRWAWFRRFRSLACGRWKL
jgi:short-subunit dehydrogenase